MIYKGLKIDLEFMFSVTWIYLLTAEITCCGKSRGVEWLGVPITGINLDSGTGFLWEGDTTHMPRSPAYKDVMSETKHNNLVRYHFSLREKKI